MKWETSIGASHRPSACHKNSGHDVTVASMREVELSALTLKELTLQNKSRLFHSCPSSTERQIGCESSLGSNTHLRHTRWKCYYCQLVSRQAKDEVKARHQPPSIKQQRVTQPSKSPPENPFQNIPMVNTQEGTRYKGIDGSTCPFMKHYCRVT